MDFTFFAAAGGIALLDIVLSGDNALVIAAAASRLPPAQRRIAILWGGIGALVFRIALTAIATELLRVRLLQAIGGLALLFIAVRVLPGGEEGGRPRRASERLFAAVVTILVADATMSLDNILAVAALAAGHVVLLVAGLVVSMALLFLASALIARLMDMAPLLLDLAALVIAWTAANLFTADPLVRQTFHLTPIGRLAVQALFVAIVLAIDVWERLARRRARRGAAAAETSAGSAPAAALIPDDLPPADPALAEPTPLEYQNGHQDVAEDMADAPSPLFGAPGEGRREG